MIDDPLYLPAGLAARSLSTREIVLTLPDTDEAVRLLPEQNIAVLGWEAWALYPDGRKGHAGCHHSDYPDRQSHESWPEFVKRAARDCLETAQKADTYFKANPPRPDALIHYCLTIATELD